MGFVLPRVRRTFAEDRSCVSPTCGSRILQAVKAGWKPVKLVCWVRAPYMQGTPCALTKSFSTKVFGPAQVLDNLIIWAPFA